MRNTWCEAHQLADHRASPAHTLDRGIRVVAKLLCHLFGATSAAVRTDGRGDGLPGLTRAGLIGTLQG